MHNADKWIIITKSANKEETGFSVSIDMNDYIVRGMTMDGFVKVAAIRSTNLVAEAARIHISTFAIFCALLVAGIKDPSILQEGLLFKAQMFTAEKNQPIIPMLFVTIACGIISGFHATQSPIVARTMRSERQARSTFYGMMVAEGIIGMIWAGAGLAIYNLYPHYMVLAPAKVLSNITTHFLGSVAGNITIYGMLSFLPTIKSTRKISLHPAAR